MNQMTIDLEKAELLEQYYKDLKETKESKHNRSLFYSKEYVGWVITFDYVETVDGVNYHEFITYQYHKGIMTLISRSKTNDNRYFVPNDSELFNYVLSFILKTF